MKEVALSTPIRPSLPSRPDLNQLRKQAKELLRAHRSHDPQVARRIRSHHPLFAASGGGDSIPFRLNDAQLVIARELGFASWPRLKRHVELHAATRGERIEALIRGLCSDQWREAAQALAMEPELAHQDLPLALAAGEPEAARGLLATDPAQAGRPMGSVGWEPLLYVCHSRLLGADSDRAPALRALGRELLALGADPNAYFTVNDDPNARQTCLYGAAGINADAELTGALLAAGADPNDAAPGLGPESLYHASEHADLSCLRLILEAGPDPDKVHYCLARKLDFEDLAGARLYLDFGADPNFTTPFGDRHTRLHHAIKRRRSPAIIALLLEHGAEPERLTAHGETAYALALRLGQAETADLLLSHGADPAGATPMDRFVGACARGDREGADAVLAEHPDLPTRLTKQDQRVLVDAAAANDLEAVEVLLDYGFDIDAEGDNMSPLHWALWEGHPDMVTRLVERGARLDTVNGYGGDPVDNAVYAIFHGPKAAGRVDMIRTLLEAGASTRSIENGFPTGHTELDALLTPYFLKSYAEGERAHPHVQIERRRMEKLFPGDSLLELTLLEELTRSAQDLATTFPEGDEGALARVRNYFPGGEPAAAKSFDLAEACLTVAREHGFQDWAEVTAHPARRHDRDFEAAVDAVVTGDLELVKDLLTQQPELARARSSYGHRATLLHYVAANGVEIRRQETPRNAPAIAHALLSAGAEPDALAETYGGGPRQTPLCLLVSSGHPAAVGVQVALTELLLAAGANPDGIEEDGAPLETAIAFRYEDTARALIRGGARIEHALQAAREGGHTDLVAWLEKEQGGA